MNYANDGIYGENENCIEFLSGQHHCTVSFTSRKFINKIDKLYEKYTDEFVFYKKNSDGSVYARVPIRWLKLSNIKRDREYTDEEREQLKERIKKMHEAKKSKKNKEKGCEDIVQEDLQAYSQSILL